MLRPGPDRVTVFRPFPWLNALGVQWASGSLFALNLKGVPFADPVDVPQVTAGGFAPAVRLLAGAALFLVPALLLDRVFRGWICPCGLFSELLRGLRRRAADTRPESGPV
ncbi:4Fe-4S binding protein [uncultured Desulfovibrio sp.]|uniref:4Fe-4S binding protein n=1 Tax=uncultured Desulfovibrio sp. TaxID=167968 RepID=UPI0003A118E8|nr:4Fe-4S binding protein [uncultured Desulfovibrio sp.]